MTNLKFDNEEPTILCYTDEGLPWFNLDEEPIVLTLQSEEDVGELRPERDSGELRSTVEMPLVALP